MLTTTLSRILHVNKTRVNRLTDAVDVREIVFIRLVGNLFETRYGD